jgi:trimethylamine:corrinoid methyltransferase-like protein
MFKLEDHQASIQPIQSKLRVSILDDKEISLINQNTRKVLEDVGVKFPSEKALKLFARKSAETLCGRWR